MRFEPSLIPGTLIKRYKRFLADVEMENGDVITVHCANPGSMLGLTEPGIPAYISDSQNPKRKLQYSLELVEVEGELIGINTNHPNKLALEAIESSRITQLTGYDGIRTEVKYGTNSRIDILLENKNSPDIYVEVKNVHFVRNAGLFEFPDSVTERGAKHLIEMTNEVAKGNRAAMLYVIQRSDGDALKIAGDLDPNYAQAFETAIANGVEAYAIRCEVRTDRIDATDLVPIL